MKLLDKDGYPTKNALKKLKNWKHTHSDFNEFLDFIKSVWWSPDWGWHESKGKDDFTKKPIRILSLSTGGWSGNEDIIDAMSHTWFWMLYWKESRRGGHYTFEFPV